MPVDTSTLPTLAKQIQAFRKARGWSQPDLANKIGAHHTMVGRYERGEMTPAVDIVAKLAEVFGVTLDHLFHGGNVPEALQDKTMLARWEAISSLPNTDRSLILAALDALIRDAKTRQNYGGSQQAG